MDVADATASNAWPPVWSLFRGYFTPATLFLLVNLVIGTIALSSRSQRRHRHDHDHDHDHDGHQLLQQQHFQQYGPPPPAPLARTSSVMERLRSLGLYRFCSGDFHPEYNHPAEDENKQQPHYVRSQSEPAARPAVARKKEGEAKAAAKIKKSSSETKRLERSPDPVPERQWAARAPARMVEEEAVAGSVDERADDFINKFRQQLQLQRLNSLLNYKEMLNRGN